VTATTPTFALPYLEVGQPMRDTRLVLEQLAKGVDTALAARGVAPPAAADLAALAGRVSTLEAGRLLARAERLSSTAAVTTTARTIVDSLTVAVGTPVAGASGTGGVSFAVTGPTRVQLVVHGKMHATASTAARVHLLVAPGVNLPATGDANVVGMVDVPWSNFDPTFTYECDTLLATAGTYTAALALSNPANAVAASLFYEANTSTGRPLSSTVLKVRAMGAS
jgi:hypothetical protein